MAPYQQNLLCLGLRSRPECDSHAATHRKEGLSLATTRMALEDGHREGPTGGSGMIFARSCGWGKRGQAGKQVEESRTLGTVGCLRGTAQRWVLDVCGESHIRGPRSHTQTHAQVTGGEDRLISFP